MFEKGRCGWLLKARLRNDAQSRVPINEQLLRNFEDFVTERWERQESLPWHGGSIKDWSVGKTNELVLVGECTQTTVLLIKRNTREFSSLLWPLFSRRIALVDSIKEQRDCLLYEKPAS